MASADTTGHLIGEGQESCIFKMKDKMAMSIRKRKPSKETVQKYAEVSDILLRKDPTQQYFVSGRQIHAATIQQLAKLEYDYINLDECSELEMDKVYFSVLPHLEHYTGGQIKHLRDGLALLHSTHNGTPPVVHGDIKRDNIMVHNGMPVFIDWGHAHIGSREETAADTRSIEKDNQYFLEKVVGAPPEAPTRKRGPSPRRRSRSNSSEEGPPRISRSGSLGALSF